MNNLKKRKGGSFKANLKKGKKTENKIYKFFDGYVSYTEPNEYRLDGKCLPDAVLFNMDGNIVLCESKSKSTWYINEEGTGVDWKKWIHYVDVWRKTKILIWFIFHHTDSGHVYKLSIHEMYDKGPRRVNGGTDIAVWDKDFIKEHRLVRNSKGKIVRMKEKRYENKSNSRSTNKG